MLTEFICIKHQMHQSILKHQSMSLKERARIPVNSAEWELNACHLVHTVSLCYCHTKSMPTLTLAYEPSKAPSSIS